MLKAAPRPDSPEDRSRNLIVCLDQVSFESAWAFRKLRLARRVSAVRYMRGSALGLRILRLWLPRNVPLRQVDFELGLWVDEHGRSLRYQLEEDLTVASDLAADDLLGQWVDGCRRPLSLVPRQWVIRYFRHAVIGLLQPLILAWMVLTHVPATTDPGWRPPDIVLLKRRPFTEYCRLERPGDRIRVVWYSSPTARAGFEMAARLAVIMTNGFLSLLGPALGSKYPRPSQSVVAVQYCWGHDTRGRSDLYWWPGSGLPADRVLMYFDRPDRPLTPDIRAALQGQGLKHLVRRTFLSREIYDLLSGLIRHQGPTTKATDLSRSRRWLPGPRFGTSLLLTGARHLLPLIKGTGSIPLAERRWLAAQTLKLLHDVVYWRDFFSAHQVKVQMNHSGDSGPLHVVHSMAMHLAGGANVRSTYSFMFLRGSNDAREFHVYFNWGTKPRCDRQSEYLAASRYKVVAGYLFDYLFRLSDPEGTPGLAGNPEFVVALYDEPDCEICVFHRQLVDDFYQAFFQWVRDDPRIGLVIKSKDFDRAALSTRFPDFASAEATGRVSVFPPHLRPFLAARSAHLAVGLGYNSAGVEAALLGRPVIYLVHHQALCPWLSDHPPARIVFRSLEDLMAAAREMADGATDSHLGDHAAIIDGLDPWRDGRGGLRVGWYLYDFLAALDSGLDRDQALAAANTHYAALWGGDKIWSADWDESAN